MRRPVVAGNWKMHGSRAANETLLTDLADALNPDWRTDVAVFPPYVYLADAVRLLEGRMSEWARRTCVPSRSARSRDRWPPPC